MRRGARRRRRMWMLAAGELTPLAVPSKNIESGLSAVVVRLSTLRPESAAGGCCGPSGLHVNRKSNHPRSDGSQMGATAMAATSDLCEWDVAHFTKAMAATKVSWRARASPGCCEQRWQ